jgi:hypothetical protein
MLKSCPIVLRVAAILLWLTIPARAEWQLIRGDYLWLSANMRVVANPAAGEKNMPESTDLSLKAYHRHFDEYGQAPPWTFLKPLTPEASALAELDGYTLKFLRTGSQTKLDVGRIPVGSSPAQPYLMTTADSAFVLAVLPYYFVQCKDNDYLVWVFTAGGEFKYLWRTLPTHFLQGQPQLLVAAEKAGCCESLRFSFRFYNLADGSVSAYACPEGFCGDVVFEELAPDGPLLIGLEVLGGLRDVGASLLTNIFVVGRDGGLQASCSLLEARPGRLESIHAFRRRSAVGLSALRQLFSTPGQGRQWVLKFSQPEGDVFYGFEGGLFPNPPAVVFIQSARTRANDGVKVYLPGVAGPIAPPLMALVREGTAALRYEAASGETQTLELPIRGGSVEIVSLH